MTQEKKETPAKASSKSSTAKVAKQAGETAVAKAPKEEKVTTKASSEGAATPAKAKKSATQTGAAAASTTTKKVVEKKKPASKKKIQKKVPTKRVLKKGKMSSEAMESKFGDLLINLSAEDSGVKIPKTAAHCVGKRKASVARVWVWPISKGQKSVISVNGRDCLSYFNNSPKALLDISKPFSTIDESASNYCVVCKVAGGGVAAQSGAARLGISKCLLALLPHMRPALKKEKLLRRDSRVVEPKKTGLRKARKREQFSKR